MTVLLLSLLANANQSHELDAPIVGAKPAELDTIDAVEYLIVLDGARGAQDVEVDSDWAYIVCGVKDEHFYYRFRATDDDWPSSFPGTVTCSQGSRTLVLNLTARKDSWDVLPGGMTTSNGVSVSYPDVDGKPVGGMRTFDLPSGDYTEMQWVSATTTQGGWRGVQCLMAFVENEPKLRVFVDPAASAGSGSCEIPNPSGPSHVIPVDISR